MVQLQAAQIHWVDWLIIALFIGVIVIIGSSFGRVSGKNIASFFLGGRNMPWYLAGISMVATTFAADTPLAVAEIVGTSGIAGNWIWWNFLIGGLLTTFFFAKLWRRSGVVTEVELITLRYGGKPAQFLRKFKAVYLGLFMNVCIIGWVNLAMVTILRVFFDLDRNTALLIVGGLLTLVAIYSSISGLLGIAVTDAIQFVVAITGCIILAVLVVNSGEIGGLSGLKTKVTAISSEALSFFPSPKSSDESSQLGTTLSLGIGSFLAYFAVQWWGSWYPGAEPGGGGYVAQRMLATKNEKHAVYATLMFQVAHYAIRPWPWIIVGLCAISIYNFDNALPDGKLKNDIHLLQTQGELDSKVFTVANEAFEALAIENSFIREHKAAIESARASIATIAADSESLEEAIQYTNDNKNGFVMAMKTYLPIGLKGLLLAAFLAAFMSTISTQLNWGASYLVNDLIAPLTAASNQRSLVIWSRIVTVILMVIGLIATTFMTSISGMWGFIMECGAGLGLVLILRWYWWRINVWSEIVATIAPFGGYIIGHYMLGLEFPNAFFFTTAFTTIAWLIATFLTAPESESTLTKFHNQVKPNGWWGAFKSDNKSDFKLLVLCWISAIVLVYGALFGIGKLLFLEYQAAALFGVLVVIAGILLYKCMNKLNYLTADE